MSYFVFRFFSVAVFLQLFLCSAFYEAQVTRFVYEYRFVPDSLNQKEIKTELMYLDVSGEKSEFFSADKYKVDSTLSSNAEKGIFGMPPNIDYIEYRITKFKNNSPTIMHQPLISEDFAVNINTKFDWKLLNESSMVLGKKAQKASTNFGERKWNAWFCEEIPISDGPYKFRGLPGLIMMIEDVDKSHIFELIAIKNISNYEYEDKFFKKKSNGEIKISQKEYSRIYGKYIQDPVAHLVDSYPDQTDSSGNFRTSAEILREIKDIQMKKIKKNNNILELDLLQHE